VLKQEGTKEIEVKGFYAIASKKRGAKYRSIPGIAPQSPCTNNRGLILVKLFLEVFP